MGRPGPDPLHKHYIGKCALNMQFFSEGEVNSFDYKCLKLSSNLQSTSVAAGLTVMFCYIGENKYFLLC